MIQDPEKGVIFITGIPASGKSFLSRKIKQHIVSKNKQVKILEIDRFQAMISKCEQFQKQQNILTNFLKQSDWQIQLQKYELNKQNFNEKTWKLARQYCQKQQFLNIFIKNTQILIIQDELPLKSSRKPYRKYCYSHNLQYLQIQIQISLQKALEQNYKRGQTQFNNKVPEQIIKKSYQKFEHNEFAHIVQSEKGQQFINNQNILSLLKKVLINDNYSQYLQKKSNPIQLTKKQLDQNQIRKLISQLMKSQQLCKEYFSQYYKLSNKIKGEILNNCKKIYLQKKRMVQFKIIVEEYLKGNREKYEKLI